MLFIKKELSFCAAHRLPDHRGKCRFIHGHNYKVVVTLTSSKVDKNGMVMDFSHVKNIVGEYLDENYDHRLILEGNDPLLGILKEALPAEQSKNIKAFPGTPTAENMAELFLSELRIILSGEVSVVGVEVWETPTACASAMAGGL
jgi:6-pyruvoyltetrahydropterin/6-carboxytetrahydropterin synthase